MSKRPTPKQQRSKRNTRTRYASYVRKQTTKLKNRVNITECPNCQTPRPTHTVCPACGIYNGKTVISQKKSEQKITKLSA